MVCWKSRNALMTMLARYVDLPGDYEVLAMFNVADLSLSLEDRDDYLTYLRTNSSQLGGMMEVHP